MITLILVSLTDTKGETIFKLVRSFLNYAMFIGAVCVSLSFLGVDTTTLLASIGLLSLAISLGAKDIVADILAGLSIERTATGLHIYSSTRILITRFENTKNR